MTYIHETEWEFSGTPKQLEEAVRTLLDRRPDLSISLWSKSDGRLRVNFNIQEPFCQGWAIAQSRPVGTIISLYASKSHQWSSLETIWAIIVSELKRQGWKIHEWPASFMEPERQNPENNNNETFEEKPNPLEGNLKWYGRYTPSGKALHCTIKLTPDQLFREIGKFAELVWLDLLEKDEYYYRDFQTKWVSYGEHFVISANKYQHSR